MSFDSMPRDHGRRILVAVALLWLLVASLARTIRAPNDFAKAHWLLGYQFGFVKRGFVGELLRQATNLFSVPVTEQLIVRLSQCAFAVFILLLLVLCLRVLRRSNWSTHSALTIAVFLSSPFIVMSGHTLGYYDSIVFSLGMVSLLLVFSGYIAAACLLQVLAMLVHESSIFLVFPVYVFACHQAWQQQKPAVLMQMMAVLLPLAVFIVVIICQSLFIDNDFEQSFAGYLSQFAFIHRERNTMVPHWFHMSFLEYFRSESPFFLDRLYSHGAALCLPAVLLLWWLLPRPETTTRFSRWSLCLLAIGLLPELLLLIAWDMARIWTYAIMVLFLLLCTCAESRPLQPPARTVHVAMLVLLCYHTVFTIPLMDYRVDRFETPLRLLLAAPAIIVLLFLSKPWQRPGTA